MTDRTIHIHVRGVYQGSMPHAACTTNFLPLKQAIAFTIPGRGGHKIIMHTCAGESPFPRRWDAADDIPHMLPHEDRQREFPSLRSFPTWRALTARSQAVAQPRDLPEDQDTAEARRNFAGELPPEAAPAIATPRAPDLRPPRIPAGYSRHRSHTAGPRSPGRHQRTRGPTPFSPLRVRSFGECTYPVHCPHPCT